MTISDLQDNVATIVEETWSESDFLVRLNRVNKRVWNSNDWAFKEFKTAYSTSTSSQALPSNKCQIDRILTTDGLVEYQRVKFSSQSQSIPLTYWIDEANSTIYFSDSGQAVNMFWTLAPTDLTISDTLPLPAQFHDLYLYGIVVDYFLGEDVDDLNNKKAEFWAGNFNTMMNQLIDYDANIKCNEINGQPRIYSDDYLIAKGIVPNYYD